MDKSRYFTITLLESFSKFTLLATALKFWVFFLLLQLSEGVLVRIHKSNLFGKKTYFTITVLEYRKVNKEGVQGRISVM